MIAPLAILLVCSTTTVGAADYANPFADLAARLLPAVVNISTTQLIKPDPAAPDESAEPPRTPYEEFFKDFLEHHGATPKGDKDAHGRKGISLGSGFIIDPTGLVVTNNHVIADADEITVILQDNTNLKAKLIGRDEQTDIALLKVNVDHPLPAVKFGDSDKERVGDWVMAVGNPFGLGGTVTVGILSARAREISQNGGPYDDFLQTDAAINRGNSGGPLFNTNGQVIGINSAIYSPSGGSIGIGFAIASNLAQHVTQQLQQFGHLKRGYIGVRVQNLTPELEDTLGVSAAVADKADPGVLIAGFPTDSPAEHAGLKPGDVLLQMNGNRIKDARHLERFVDDAAVDANATLTVWRAGAVQTVDVKVAELPDAEKTASAPAAHEDVAVSGSQIAALGVTLSPATSALKEKYQLNDNAAVVVTGVADGGPAADKDLKPGDVVVEVAQEEIKGLGDVTRKVDEAEKLGRKSVLMLIDRSGDLRFVALRLNQG
jgi:serine protease Do